VKISKENKSYLNTSVVLFSEGQRDENVKYVNKEQEGSLKIQYPTRSGCVYNWMLYISLKLLRSLNIVN